MLSGLRLLVASAVWLGLFSNVLAQSPSGTSPTMVNVCAAAASSYAEQTEVFSDAIKLLMYETRNNPSEQALRLEALKPRQQAFQQQALAQAQAQRSTLALTPQEAETDVQVKTWVIQHVLDFATDKYGQDKLFFKFYIVNRCKKQFGL
jgi:hypothetical protein